MKVQPGVAHCFRCVYSWQPRKIPIRMCPRCKSRLWNTPRLRQPGRRRRGLGIEAVVGPHLRAIKLLAHSYGVRRLRVFGSVARGEANRSSDVDIMFDVVRPIGLLRRLEFQERLEGILGRRVDLVREEGLHWYVRPYAVAEAVVL